MTDEQKKILDLWEAAGMIAPTKYWPFDTQDPKELAKDRKAEGQKRVDDAGEALL